MTADMYLKVDTTKEEKMEISGTIGMLKNLLEAFQKIGYAGTDEREGALEVTIDTLQMILRGEVF